MAQSQTRRCLQGYLLLLLLALALLLANLALGSETIPLGDLPRLLLHPEDGSVAGRILWQFRAPRALSAALLGGALSLSGFLLQTFFANPIAGPFVLGVSSGAKLAVALTLILALRRDRMLTSPELIGAAFLGSLLSLGFILALSGTVKRMSLLVICGVMIGYICSAVTDFAVTFSDDSSVVNLHSWSLGTFSGLSWSAVAAQAPVILLGLVWSFLLSKPMAAYQLGETSAASMGVRLGLFRVQLILLSSLLAACVTAFAGPISFVGIAAPHLVRSLLRTGRPILVLPACFLGGAVFCLFCDLLARTLAAPVELSISSVTAVLGAPVVIWLMVRRQGRAAL